MSTFAGDGLPLLRSAASLMAVLALVVGALWLLRKQGRGAVGGGHRGSRLGIVASHMIDNRVRIVLLRRDGREHLLAVGPAGVTLIESLHETAANLAVNEPC